MTTMQEYLAHMRTEASLDANGFRVKPTMSGAVRLEFARPEPGYADGAGWQFWTVEEAAAFALGFRTAQDGAKMMAKKPKGKKR